MKKIIISSLSCFMAGINLGVCLGFYLYHTPVTRAMANMSLVSCLVALLIVFISINKKD